VQRPEIGWLPTAPIALRRAASEFGDRDLLVTPSDRLTFRDAEARSRVLGKRLLESGVGKGTRVGMQFSYSVEFVVSLLAVTRIGGLAAPLSTAYSPAELQGAIRRADVDTLLLPPRLLGRNELQFVEEAIPELGDAVAGRRLACTTVPYLRQVFILGASDRPWAATVDVDHEPDTVSEALFEEIEAAVVPADLLVLIQTSGSTADPKGVLHTHGAAFRTIAAGPAIPGPIFLSMPFFWVGGLLSLWSALHNGATLVCQERFEPAEALDLIEAHRVTLVASWFTVTNALRNHPSVPGRDLSCIPALTRTPGEQPYATPLGMTETLGPHMTFPHPDHGMSPPEHLWGSNGITAPFVEHRLVDPDTGAEIDGDGEGELCVRGHSVTIGMYKRERDEVFDADGWYHTGDRVARHDGLWWFVGRTTEMIKVRGANVAPPEVEAALESHPDVEHAFVLALPHPEFEEQVAAVIVPRAGAALDLDELATTAARLMSRYKVPTVFVTIEEDDVPWLATGKPDKRAMRRMLTKEGKVGSR
jgi:acyl-CoA synthetase (AMP-forming)/AMP-acid ligase II